MSEPSKAHFAATKRILRYIKDMKNYGLPYKIEKDLRLVGYTNSEWGRCIDERKSIGGYVFQLGSKAIYRSSQKQAKQHYLQRKLNTLQLKTQHVKQYGLEKYWMAYIKKIKN